jgi:YVTN family beta-propeller protein
VHFTPDGRFGFTPERDQDTVSKIDLVTRRVVQSVEFPSGSKPYMLRVDPSGKELWVLTADARTTVVLDVERMTTLHTESVGRGPVQCAFGPTGGRHALVTHLDETFVLVLERETGQVAARIEVGGAQANASFTPDGATAYVTVTSRNEVVAIDMSELAVVGTIRVGEDPMGLVLLDPSATATDES